MYSFTNPKFQDNNNYFPVFSSIANQKLEAISKKQKKIFFFVTRCYV